ncbi:MAG: class I SAM-dependent rRNA methyltransferase [Treponema sp.]|jgi:23S rRNA (cytosine1962-C5)-methyltransferase|nr:class I SAM-dependent rRNA methyltransferase [Treponema sp.]
MIKRVVLNHGEEQRILAGHPWIFDNEIQHVLVQKMSGSVTAEMEPGEIVDVEYSRQGKPAYLGRGFANPHSKIAVRIYSPSKEGVDKGFFKRRIREAQERRLAAGFRPERESARLVFAEADRLPGLIVDCYTGWEAGALRTAAAENGNPAGALRFEDAETLLGPPASWLSLQFLSYGMDMRRDMILQALDEALKFQGGIAGIIEKSAPVRELEGLPLMDGLIRGTFPADGIIVFENGYPFRADLLSGQKTGTYLDQRDNHRLASKRARLLAALNAESKHYEGHETEKPAFRILDLFSYHGAFAIHALRGAGEGAEALAVDSSAEALETARLNARLNGLEGRLETREGDVFDILKSLEKDKEKFDMIILDPPAFAKTKSALEGALRGYKEINLKALRLLKAGGILVTCCCSQALDEFRFREIVAAAAADSGRRLRLLDFRYQAQDHPILLGYGESLYLKCGIFRAD